MPFIAFFRRRRAAWPALVPALLLILPAAGAQATTWKVLPAPATANLNAIACASSSQCWSVGAGGTILATADSAGTWTSQGSGTASTLQGIACPSTAGCVTVGSAGTILTGGGAGGWTARPSGTTAALHAVACPTTGQCLAVGDGGTILASADGGASWSAQSSGTAATLEGVACPVAGTCFVAGGAGTLLKLTSTSSGPAWAAEASGTGQDLNSVACASATRCTAVGGGGVNVNTANGGASWATNPPVSGDGLLALACNPSFSECWETGSGGTVASFLSNNPWAPEASGSTAALHGVACPSTSRCLAVGDGGTVLAGTPVPTTLTPPTIAGSVQDRQVLSAASTAWTGLPAINLSAQWEDCDSTGSNCTKIAGATGASYTLSDHDVGHTLRVLVNGANTLGATTVSSAATAVVPVPTAPVATASPVLWGTAMAGEVLSVSNGAWQGTPSLSFTYQWQRCDAQGANCSSIAGATYKLLTLGTADAGHVVRALVTAHNFVGTGVATSSATETIAAAAPALTATPTCPAAASCVFVAPGGSDSAGDGSLLKPFRTVSRALQSGAGYVFVAAGDYPAVTDYTQRAGWVTVEGYDPAGAGARPTIHSVTQDGSTTTRPWSLDLLGASRLHFQNFNFTEEIWITCSPRTSAPNPGSCPVQPAHDILITDSDISSSSYATCALISYGAHDVTLDHDHLHGCYDGVEGPGYGEGTATVSGPPYYDGQTRDVTLSNDLIEGETDNGVAFGNWSYATLYRVTIRNSVPPSSTTIHPDAIQFYGNGQHIIVSSSTVHDTGDFMMIQQAIAGPTGASCGPLNDISVEDNLMYDGGSYGIQNGSASDITFANNTVWNTRYAALLIRQGYAGCSAGTGVVVVNNILSGFGYTGGGAAAYEDYNWSLAGAGSGAHDVLLTDTVNGPGFTAPTGGDYSLAAGALVGGVSPLTAGTAAYAPAVDITGAPQASPPGVGAYG